MTNASTKLSTIVLNIKAEVANIRKSSIIIGRLLSEARGEFAKAADFLKWADETVQFKKAMVYRLISVYEAFNDKPELHAMSVSALAMLIGEPEVAAQVSELAKAGEKVTEAEVKQMVAEVKEERGEEPKPAKPAAPKATPEEKAVTVAAAQKAQKAAEDKVQQMADKFAKATEKHNTERDAAIKTSRDLQKVVAELEEKLAKAQNTILERDEEIAKLKAELESKSTVVDTKEPEVVEDIADTEAYVEELKMAEVGENDDLPWFTDEELEAADKPEAHHALATFETAYLELKAEAPRKMVENTLKAAEAAQIEHKMEGARKVVFNINGEWITGAELRALIA